MIKFGPSGNSESFFSEGFSATVQMPKWLSERGLDVFEYSFGRGVMLSEKTARAIADEARKYNIEITAHAPYYINFANPDDEKAENGYGYLLQSLNALRWLGGKRCVFHSGTEGKMPREEAVQRIYEKLVAFKNIKKAEGFDDMIVCPETMGKLAQIGDVREVVDFCKIDESYYPCVDFGHMNARTGGSLKTAEDYESIVKYIFNELGEERAKNIHIHFSKIQYGAKGEIRHLTFEDEIYGPEFSPLAQVLCKYAMTPVVISESAGTQAEDAKFMKDCYFALVNAER